MTTQAANQVILKEEKFNLIGFTNEGLIKPQDFGITPQRVASFCWRGFITTYEIDPNENFLLKEMIVHSESNDEIKKINGVAPKPLTNKWQKKILKRSYQEIDLKTKYSGYILIGKDFIEELYVHMGFHPAWKYRKVYEIEIEVGKVKSIKDLSEKMTKYREIIMERNEHPDLPKNDKIEEWVKKKFDQKYKK